MKVWLDGRITGPDEARIPVTDHGLLYGDGVFEGIRIRHRRVFRLDAHLRRLATSARALALELPHPPAAVRDAVLETARALDRDDAYVRLIVTRGDGGLGADPTPCTRPRLICIAAGIEIYDDAKRARGLDLVTASGRRAPPDVLDARVKSLNYLTGVLAKLEARQRGADEALLLNTQGAVAEASVANVFCVTRGAVRTPPPSEGALDGITRGAVLELARAQGLEASEERLGRIDLFAADEVFLTGSGAGIASVRSLDGRAIGAGRPGPIAGKLAAAFDELALRDGVPF